MTGDNSPDYGEVLQLQVRNERADLTLHDFSVVKKKSDDPAGVWF
jgi:hypothetical protein